MKAKTADLIGPALDWAVAKCEGYTDLRKNCHTFSDELVMTPPRAEYGAVALADLAISWERCGPLIERECLDVRVFAEHGALDGGPYWISERYPAVGHGPTPLIAAMRCVVAANLGDEVDVPDELV